MSIQNFQRAFGCHPRDHPLRREHAPKITSNRVSALSRSMRRESVKREAVAVAARRRPLFLRCPSDRHCTGQRTCLETTTTCTPGGAASFALYRRNQHTTLARQPLADASAPALAMLDSWSHVVARDETRFSIMLSNMLDYCMSRRVQLDAVARPRKTACAAMRTLGGHSHSLASIPHTMDS